MPKTNMFLVLTKCYKPRTYKAWKQTYNLRNIYKSGIFFNVKNIWWFFYYLIFSVEKQALKGSLNFLRSFPPKTKFFERIHKTSNEKN
jgi:hypothetical protein